MDGDIAPLRELARVCADERATLMIDDAHGLGVLGATGRGCCEHFGLGATEVPLLVGTFGKAFGTFGAFVAGDADLVEFLLQKSRTYIYTTALPPAVAAATRAALRVSAQESWRREKARSLARRLRHALGDPDAATTPGTTIIPVIVGDAGRALALSARLEAQGFLVTAIRPPTVPPGTARLRVTLSAAHEEAQVDALSNALAQALAA
jgi:8-amino-7-oxononanoate synthase